MKARTFKIESSLGSPLVAGRRALRLVELVGAQRGGLSFSELSQRMELSSASLTRLLKMLVAEEWIRPSDVGARYVAGSRLFELGDDLRSHHPLADLVAPVVYDLAHETGHSACVAAFQGDHFILLAKTEHRGSYHFIDVFTPNFDWIGNGMGQLLLAYQPEETVSRIYREHFEMEVPREHWERFGAIRETGTFVRTEGIVTRFISAVRAQGDAAPVENVVSLAALSTHAPDAQAMLAAVCRAARTIEQRFELQRVALRPAAEIAPTFQGRRK